MYGFFGIAVILTVAAFYFFGAELGAFVGIAAVAAGTGGYMIGLKKAKQ